MAVCWHVNCLCTCVNGGPCCPGGLYERSYQLQNDLHHVQKGGDLPVIIYDPAGQGFVDHRHRLLQPGGGGQQETESDRGRLSGYTAPQVNINSLHSCAQTAEHHVTELDRSRTGSKELKPFFFAFKSQNTFSMASASNIIGFSFSVMSRQMFFICFTTSWNI